jgi:rhodanese-related sulfurtransferase
MYIRKGYAGAKALRGGVDAWKNAGFPVGKAA